MNLFQEITESRMIRTLESVDGLSTDDLGKRLFQHLLALQLLAHTNKREARQYASKVCEAITFPGFRIFQRDLYNLITLLLQQDKYKERIKDFHPVKLPILFIRRNLLAIANGHLDDEDYNRMMILLQREFSSVINSRTITLRREISDWPALSRENRRLVLIALLWQMRERADRRQSDLYLLIDPQEIRDKD